MNPGTYSSLMVWEFFRGLLANSKWAVMCLLLRSAFCLAMRPGVVLQERLSFWKDSPISTEELWSSVKVTIGFLVTSLTQALLPRLSISVLFVIKPVFALSLWGIVCKCFLIYFRIRL
jgi:hypothetical protein